MMAEKQEIIVTKLFNSRTNGRDFIEKREMLVQEAINFPQGTFEKQKKNVVFKFADNKEAYFLKPGKEARRKTPNVHDMLPNVAGHFDMWAFERIWEYLIKISIVQQATFKEVLVLLYRLCYYTDHKFVNNKLRYKPSKQILEYINSLEKFVLKRGFQEKFKTSEVSLLELLYFVDLLAWNEDVKYHSNGNKANFSEKNKTDVGRVNTIMSLIYAPVLISKFINNVIENTPKGIIKVELITGAIQKFTKSRGLCLPTKKDLVEFLQPYLIEK
jgi:hypothetical protein